MIYDKKREEVLWDGICCLVVIVRLDLIILLIMLTINKKIEDNSKKILPIDPFDLVPNLSHASKHRNTFTAKLRPRTFFSAGKASRLEQKGNTIQHEQQPNPIENDYSPSRQEVQGVLSQFDNLKLEDFLKVVIVGKTKLSQTKSKQIIRSLNGTWFKNTDSKSPANKLYCSLPIRRQRSSPTVKNDEQEMMRKMMFSDKFQKNYTPPNLFPKRKANSSIHRSAQIKPEQPRNTDPPLQINTKIVQKFKSLRQISQQSKRKRHHPSSRPNVAVKYFEEQNNYLVGRKMVIHD